MMCFGYIKLNIWHADSIFLKRAIEQEKDPALKEALQDLDDFLFGW